MLYYLPLFSCIHFSFRWRDSGGRYSQYVHRGSLAKLTRYEQSPCPHYWRCYYSAEKCHSSPAALRHSQEYSGKLRYNITGEIVNIPEFNMAVMLLGVIMHFFYVRTCIATNVFHMWISGLNKVVLTEKIDDSEMEVAAGMLKTKLVKVSLKEQKVVQSLREIQGTVTTLPEVCLWWLYIVMSSRQQKSCVLFRVVRSDMTFVGECTVPSEPFAYFFFFFSIVSL